jgi:hypothetical protein
VGQCLVHPFGRLRGITDADRRERETWKLAAVEGTSEGFANRAETGDTDAMGG